MSTVQLALDDPETGYPAGVEHRVKCADVFRRNGITWCVFQCTCGYDSPLIAGRLNGRQAWIEHRDGDAS